MAHVLILFAEALPAPEVVFSLLAAGHRITAVSRGGALPLARLPVTLRAIPAPEADAPGAIGALRALMAGPDAPDAVLPLDDAGLWLTDAALGEDARIAGATGGRVALALDKAAQVRAAAAAGLAVPPTVVVEDPAAVPAELRFPAIAKPALALAVRDGRLTKGDAAYLPDAGAAARFFAGVRAADGPWLVQPLIAGQGTGVFGLAGPGGVTAWSGHRRLRMMNPHGSGASACIAEPPDADLRARVAAFVTAIGWRGPFMVELLRDAGGTSWFMELNGRMWGSMALARRQGLEYPAWAVAQARDAGFVPDPPPVSAAEPLTVRHLGRELLHLAFTARGPKSAFHKQGWPRLGASLPAVLRPGAGAGFYNHDPAFPRYFLHDALWTLRKAVGR